MENFEYMFSKEESDLIEYVGKKFNYNDDLKAVLKGILPAMLEGVSYEDRQLFYDMLKETPIVLVPEEKKIKSQDIVKKFMDGVNPHIVDVEKETLTEYEKQEPQGAFVVEPVLDENLQLVGKKQFLYVKYFEVPEDPATLPDSKLERYSLFNTSINVPYLMHELGHAWAAQDNPFSIENGVLTQRIGTNITKYKLTKSLEESGKFTREEIESYGLMTEESLNTNMEDQAVARFLHVSPERLEQLYKESWAFVPSTYKGLMSEMTKYLMEKTNGDDILQWRLHGDEEALSKIVEAMKQTKEYEYRSTETQDKKAKKALFANPTNERMKTFFEAHYDDFFPDNEDQEPMQILDNVLLQSYDLVTNKLVFNITDEKEGKLYGDIVKSIVSDGYILINQTADVLEQAKVSESHVVEEEKEDFFD